MGFMKAQPMPATAPFARYSMPHDGTYNQSPSDCLRLLTVPDGLYNYCPSVTLFT